MITTASLVNIRYRTQVYIVFSYFYSVIFSKQMNIQRVFSPGESHEKDENVLDFCAPILNYPQKGQTQTSMEK